MIKFDRRIIDYKLDTILVFIDGENFIIDRNSISFSESGNLIFYNHLKGTMTRYAGSKDNIYILVPSGVFDVLEGLEKIETIDVGDSEGYYDIAFKIKTQIEKYKTKMI